MGADARIIPRNGEKAMKYQFKRGLSLMLVLMMVVSLLSGLTIHADAADITVVANWGADNDVHYRNFLLQRYYNISFPFFCCRLYNRKVQRFRYCDARNSSVRRRQHC